MLACLALSFCRSRRRERSSSSGSTVTPCVIDVAGSHSARFWNPFLERI